MQILSLLHWLVPSASAQSWLDAIGGGAGVQLMWGMIKSVFPYSDVGAALPALLLAKVMQFVLTLIAGTAVCVLLYAGIQLITGGEEKKEEAKKTVMYALAGVVLALLADAIVLYVEKLILAALG